MKICVLDLIEEPDPVQAALDSARHGDRVYLPGINVHSSSHPFYEAPQGGWHVQRNIEVYGDGPGHPGTHEGTTLAPGGEDATDDIFVVEPQDGSPESVYLHAFKIKQRAGHTIPDGASGIRVTLSTDPIHALRLERVNVLNLKDTGFALDGADPEDAAIERLLITNCNTVACRGLSARIRNSRLVVAVRCSDGGSYQGGWLVERSAVLFVFVSFDGTGTGGPGNLPDQGQLLLRACRAAALDSCWFERFHEGLQKACQILGIDEPEPEPDGPVWIGGGSFGNPGSDLGAGTAGIELGYPVCNGPASVWPNGFGRVESLVDVAATGIVGYVVFPQFNNANQAPYPPLEGRIWVSSPPDNGSLASPTINREPGAGTARAFAGFIIPSFASYSEQNPSQSGMLYYDTTNQRYRVRTVLGWRTVRLAP